MSFFIDKPKIKLIELDIVLKFLKWSQSENLIRNESVDPYSQFFETPCTFIYFYHVHDVRDILLLLIIYKFTYSATFIMADVNSILPTDVHCTFFIMYRLQRYILLLLSCNLRFYVDNCIDEFKSPV